MVSRLNKRFTVILFLALLGATLGSFCGAEATLIPVFGTGQDVVGGVDQHYQISQFINTGGESVPFDPNAYLANTTYPNNGTWLTPAPGDNAAWITPAPIEGVAKNDPGLARYEGWYTYETTFDLTGFDLSTVTLSGQWASDNAGIGISLNGSPFLGAGSTIDYGSPGHYSFQYYTAFSLTSGFVDGLNTLHFIVRNADETDEANTEHPSGLLVSLSGTGDLAATPEPGTLLLLGSGLAGLGMAWKRRRQQV